jgi:hypothetical protein
LSVIRCIGSVVANSTPTGQVSISAVGDLGDQGLVGAHPLALERWQQQLALLHVLLLINPEQRVGTENRAQGTLRAGMQRLRRSLEGLLDELWIGDDHDRSQPEHADGEEGAETAAQAAEILPLAGHHRQRLQRDRHPRTRRHASVSARGDRRDRCYSQNKLSDPTLLVLANTKR